MVLEFLQKPYVFAFALSFVTAVLVWLYNRTLAPSTSPQDEARRSFFKTLAAGLLAGGALTYATTRRGRDVVAAEPFDMPSAAATVVSGI